MDGKSKHYVSVFYFFFLNQANFFFFQMPMPPYLSGGHSRLCDVTLYVLLGLRDIGADYGNQPRGTI